MQNFTDSQGRFEFPEHLFPEVGNAASVPASVGARRGAIVRGAAATAVFLARVAALSGDNDTLPAEDKAQSRDWAVAVLAFHARWSMLPAEMVGQAMRVLETLASRFRDPAAAYALGSAAPEDVAAAEAATQTGGAASARAGTLQGAAGVSSSDRRTYLRHALKGGVHRAWYRVGANSEARGDVASALSRFQRGADRGDSACLYTLGLAYTQGALGLERDLERGLNLVELALGNADEDFPRAPYVMGKLMLGEHIDELLDLRCEGLVEHNAQRGLDLVERSAALGHSPALLRMAEAYLGPERGFDCTIALRYLSLAASQDIYRRFNGCAPILAGAPEAQIVKWLLCGYEHVIDKNEEWAFKFAEIAAIDQNASALFALGYFYEVGIATEPDAQRAMAMYNLSAARGFSAASARLQQLTTGTPQLRRSLTRKDHDAKVRKHQGAIMRGEAGAASAAITDESTLVDMAAAAESARAVSNAKVEPSYEQTTPNSSNVDQQDPQSQTSQIMAQQHRARPLDQESLVTQKDSSAALQQSSCPDPSSVAVPTPPCSADVSASHFTRDEQYGNTSHELGPAYDPQLEDLSLDFSSKPTSTGTSRPPSSYHSVPSVRAQSSALSGPPTGPYTGPSSEHSAEPASMTSTPSNSGVAFDSSAAEIGPGNGEPTGPYVGSSVDASMYSTGYTGPIEQNGEPLGAKAAPNGPYTGHPDARPPPLDFQGGQPFVGAGPGPVTPVSLGSAPASAHSTRSDRSNQSANEQVNQAVEQQSAYLPYPTNFSPSDSSRSSSRSMSPAHPRNHSASASSSVLPYPIDSPESSPRATPSSSPRAASFSLPYPQSPTRLDSSSRFEPPSDSDTLPNTRDSSQAESLAQEGRPSSPFASETAAQPTPQQSQLPQVKVGGGGGSPPSKEARQGPAVRPLSSETRSTLQPSTSSESFSTARGSPEPRARSDFEQLTSLPPPSHPGSKSHSRNSSQGSARTNMTTQSTTQFDSQLADLPLPPGGSRSTSPRRRPLSAQWMRQSIVGANRFFSSSQTSIASQSRGSSPAPSIAASWDTQSTRRRSQSPLRKIFGTTPEQRAALARADRRSFTEAHLAELANVPKVPVQPISTTRQPGVAYTFEEMGVNAVTSDKNERCVIQ